MKRSAKRYMCHGEYRCYPHPSRDNIRLDWATIETRNTIRVLYRLLRSQESPNDRAYGPWEARRRVMRALNFIVDKQSLAP